MSKKLMQIRLDEQTHQMSITRGDMAVINGALSMLEKQVNCAEDYGHDYVFVEKAQNSMLMSSIFGGTHKVALSGYTYRYKCSRCGRNVDYAWDELGVKERNALKTLGVVS